MKREGWAAVVGQTFKTRNGGTARIREYRVWVDDGQVEESLEANLDVAGFDKVVTIGAYSTDGRFRYMMSCRATELAEFQAKGSKGDHPLDLVEWDRPRVR
jgi:hypothetical protein